MTYLPPRPVGATPAAAPLQGTDTVQLSQDGKTFVTGTVAALATFIKTSGATGSTGSTGSTGTAPPPATLAPLSDIAFIQPSPAPPEAGLYTVIGHFAPVGGVGPYRYTMGTDAASTKYHLIDPSGQRDASEAGFLQVYYGPVGTATETLTVTCVDGTGASLTKTLPLAKHTGTAPYLFFADQCWNTANVAGNPVFEQQWRFWAFNGDHTATDAITITDPSGLFEVADGHIAVKYGTPAAPAGSYPITISSASATETLTASHTLVIGPVPVIGPIYFTPAVVSTSQTTGVVVGTALATTQTNTHLWTLTGADATYFSMDANTGTVIIRVPPPLRTLSISLTCTDRIAVVTQAYNIPVVQGTVLPATNMTLAQTAGLDNYVRGQTIGTPLVTGITGTPAWSISYIERYTSSYLPLPLFAINAVTGLTTAPGQLSNWAYDLTFAVTDGINTCTSTISVPIAWVANAPTLYVGAGMVAAHGANGFEHLVDALNLFKNTNLGVNAGATVVIAYNSDPGYYAEDNGSGLNGTTASNLGSLQNGWQGPVRIQSASATGPRPRVGGVINPASGSGGYDVGSKGFFNLGSGDVVISGLEISWVHGPGIDNTHAMSGIRKNGDTYGDLYVSNCAIKDCDNGILGGAGPFRVFIDNNEISNFGTAYDGGGSSHSAYIGQCVEMQYTNNLSHRGTNGHNLKTRARKGTITGNRMFDGERGSASTLIEMPSGGAYTVSNNKIHKGPNAQQSGCVQYAAEYGVYAGAQNWQTNTLALDGNSFFISTPPYNHFGTCTAVRHYGVISLIDGSQSAVTMTNSSLYLAGDATTILETHATGHTAVAAISGSVTLTSPPALDLSHPGTASPVSARVGFLEAVQDGANTYLNFNQVQIDPGFDDIRIPVNAAVGTVVMALSSYGADIWRRTNLTDARINPFTAGTTYAQVQDGQWYQGTNPVLWAPTTRYAVNATTGAVTVAAPRTTVGLDWLKIRATAPGGTLADMRFYIAVV